MKKISKKQAKELAAVSALADKKIDLSDAAEVRDWSSAVVGKFYRPIKKPLTIRLDADVLAWLKAQGKGYQTRINKLLRAAMLDSPRRRRS
ncbi:MAG TPA: BrnA antitoxin family protein [Candidatus Acidoferrales bacterium]|nr:BrnA antitoxin family protein [Candidatus Acidoferrales bacterium]